VKRLALLATLSVTLLLLPGCVYFNVRQPLDTNLDATQLGSKRGQSEAMAVLGLVAWGDAGTQAAAENGGITTIRHADQENMAILGILFARYRTIVYGD